MVWLLIGLAVLVFIAIWLAIALFKWLLILAVAAGLVWLLLFVRRRV